MKTGTGTTTNNGFAHATAQALVEPVPVFISPELAGCGPVLPPQEDRPEQKTNAERNAYGRQWTTFDLTFDVPDPTFQFLPALAGVDGRRIGDGLRPFLGLLCPLARRLLGTSRHPTRLRPNVFRNLLCFLAYIVRH